MTWRAGWRTLPPRPPLAGTLRVPLSWPSSGAEWCDYLETHARRVYGLVNDIEIQAAARLASKIQEGAIQDGFTARDVCRKHWGLLDDKELVALALDELELLGWVRAEPPAAPSAPGWGRTPGPVYRINPKTRKISKNEEGRE
jgi:hypothetical protein